MSDASCYDKDTGYYRGTPLPDTIAEEELSDSQQGTPQHQQGLVNVPWDDDNFSLCLDTFPSSRLARTKYNQYPTTASPLRKQWGSSSSCSSEDADVDEEENEDDVLAHLNDTPLPGLVDNDTKSIASTQQHSRATSNTIPTPTTTPTTVTTGNTLSRVASKRDMVAGGIFPYKNNGNFLTRIGSTKKPTKIITQQYPLQRSSNRIEHISPLSSSSIILQNESDIFNQRSPSPRPSLSHRTSNASVHSKFSSHSVLSHPIHRHQHEHFGSNDSQFSDNHSQYSDSGESWKLAQRKQGSAIIVMPSTPVQSHSIVAQHHQYHHQVHLTKSPSHLQYKKYPQEDAASVSSASVRYVGDSYRDSDIKYATPLQYGSVVSSSIGFYTPQASPAPSVISRGSGSHASVSTYRSIIVPRNADELVLYTAQQDVALVKNRDSTYSQVFDPAYNGKRKKSTRKKMTSGIFSKLIKNLKQHFMKPTTTKQQ
ncbi:hypothetical protein V8B55DRAFT_1558342 [Mucor lusitanicus]|uniref:Uncharacterized protein n=2 Tax=Mucor circinelloides f. lusitanicus TaxID=29924 RepID=A0A162QFR7_MUCCL|nr:hypothetical protein FB192DRAFT_1463682 [Mucor lusitanicus]OAD01670.1 hypothetical protein MUCCIDRAFT_111010 [Mucor lusitanicus CBS 277.49]